MSDRVAVVTGGTRGIGRSIAVYLAKHGYHVAVNYPTESDNADRTLEEIRGAGGDAFGVRADISSVPEIHEMFAQAVAHYGRIDLLVNNAGVSTFEPLFEITESVWDHIHGVNLRGAFFCSQEAAQLMVDQKQPGRIVSIASISAHVGGAMEVAYCPTKSGILSLMQSFAIVLGPYGITCNSVSPGTIATELVKTQMAAAPGLLERYIERIPVKRLGTGEEVAAAVAFLASDEARYINGAEILVDGGMLINPE